MLPIKNNLAPDLGGLAYRIAQVGVDGKPAVEWEPGPVHVSANEALGQEVGIPGERSEIDDACDWLRQVLSGGPRRPADVETEAREAGISLGTLRRAKAALGVESRKSAFGGPWEWRIRDPDAEGEQTSKVRTEGAQTSGNAHLRAKPAENTGGSSKMRNCWDESSLAEHLGPDATEPGNPAAPEVAA